MTMFRRFTLIGFAVTAILASLVALTVNRFLILQELQEVKGDSADIVSHLVTPMVDPGDFREVTPASVELWAARFEHLIGVAHTERVRVWSANGVVIHASEPELIGRAVRSERLEEALQGRVVGGLETTDLGAGTKRWFEVQVPVILPGDELPVGVYALYRDYEGILRGLREGRVIVWAGSALIFGLLFITLVAVLAASRRRHMAFHDPLTGLPNRYLLNQRAARGLAAAWNKGRPAALLFLDLARFKAVNESLGHGAGDEMLRSVAARLLACAGDDDLVGRVGGDEFAILVSGEGERAHAIAGCVHQTFARPFEVAGQSFHQGINIGMSFPCAANSGFTVETWLSQAATAMAHSKEAGTPYQVFEPEMYQDPLERLRLQEDLRTALAEEHFELHFQPLVEAAGGVSGAEALIRWHHPERGMVSPGDFIPLAEETGLIRKLDRWVARTAIRQAAAWKAAGSPLKVAVNLSPQTFQDGGFVGWLRDALVAAELPPDLLTLEITEYVLANKESARAALESLAQLGVRIALDDFGTGYSSLAYLESLPIDRIKIDRRFIQGIGQRPASGAIVRTILALTRNLEIESLGEGVETAEQQRWLVAEGCQVLQGFHLGRPVPAARFPLPTPKMVGGQAVLVEDSAGHN